MSTLNDLEWQKFDKEGAVRVRSEFSQDMVNNARYGYPDRVFWFTHGKRTNTVQNAIVDIWDGPTGTYVFPTAPTQMEVVSTSAADSAAGIWVRSLHIHYLDANYDKKECTVTTNWLTPVQLPVSDVFRINYVHSASVWSAGGVAQGNISVRATVGGTVYSVVQAWFNVARQAVYTVPAGYNWYISHWQASSGSASAGHYTQITMRATQHLGEHYPGVFLIVDEVWLQDNAIAINFPIPIRIPPKTDVKISAVSDASNANTTAMAAIMWWFEKIV